MADIKLFNINGKVKEYQSGNVTLEKELQTVIENNMETFFCNLRSPTATGAVVNGHSAVHQRSA